MTWLFERKSVEASMTLARVFSRTSAAFSIARVSLFSGINRVLSFRGSRLQRLLNASQIVRIVALLLTSSPAFADEKRAVPDYDGRAQTHGDGALWIPRVLLAPLWLVYEFIVRFPIGAAITTLEESAGVQRALHVLSLGAEKNAGLAPTFFLDRGMLPTVGAYFWWDDALARGNHVRVRASTWGEPVVLASVSDRYDLDDRTSVAFVASFVRRRDALFWGLGPDTFDSARGRYRARVLDIAPGLEHELGGGLHLGTRVGVRDAHLTDRTPRVASDYTIAYQHAELAFDTRGIGSHAVGLRTVARADGAFDGASTPGSSWFGYGATVEGFWDIGASARTLKLTATTQLVDPIAGAIPFTELATLGGNAAMRGFLPGRMIDRSAAALTLAYAWPVWSFLDGEVEAATGNAFGAGLRGFAPGKLRLSGNVGLRTLSIPEAQLELLLGFGTDTFDQGTSVQSFRLAFGISHAF